MHKKDDVFLRGGIIMKKSLLKRAASVVCAAAITLCSAVEASAASRFSGSYFGTGFDYHDSGTMEISDGWSNGGMFDCTWSRNNVSFSGGKMNLSIKGGWGNFTGAEYRTKQAFGFGMYDVSMKPIKNDGVVSSFFTYTGPSDGTVWDEIDIEFLGKDTTKVQFNYYTNGVGNHEYVYNLGFDASQSFHQYGFYWDANSITWYVDKKPVYKATTNIPQSPGKIMMNVWNGTGVDEWLNRYNGRAPLTAQYDWISYTKPGSGSSNNNNNNNNNNNYNTVNNTSTNFNSWQKYKIISRNSGKAVDLYYGRKDNGTNILQYSYCGYENQKWYLQKQSNGYYIIKSASSGKVIEVQDWSSANGGNIRQWDYYGNPNQEWKIEAVDGYFRIINRLSGKALDVEARSKSDNANIIQWGYSGGWNQQWSIIPV